MILLWSDRGVSGLTVNIYSERLWVEVSGLTVNALRDAGLRSVIK